MSSVLTILGEWVSERPYWERLALDKIIAGINFSKDDYDHILQLSLEDKQLEERKTERPPLLKLGQYTQPAKKTDPLKLRLTSISNLQNVNALAPDQTLPISKNLTVIYGSNGSGKSGYARLLGCGGFTRGDQEVLYDINKPQAARKPQTAEICFKDGDADKKIIYEVGKDCPELKSYYVFDSSSVSVHLTKTNKISFIPTGLAYLTKLGEVIDYCNDQLKQKTTAFLNPHTFGRLFQPQSDTSRIIIELIEKGKETELKKLASFSEDETKKIQEIDKEIVRLKTQDRTLQIAETRQKIRDLQQLIQALKTIEQSLSDTTLDEINRTLETIDEQQSIAENLSEDQFATPMFSQIGSQPWRHFIEAAFTLASAEEQELGTYPNHEDPCLLCRQPLSQDARELLHKLRVFLRDQSQSQLKILRNDLDKKRKVLLSTDLDCFDEQQVSFRLINQGNQLLAEKIKTFLDLARQRRDQAVQSIQSLTPCTITALSQSGIDEIEQMLLILESEIVILENENPTSQISKLEVEMTAFNHREILNKNLVAILKWISDKKWAEKAHKALGTTTHISKKYDEIFDLLVTSKYVDVFQRVLQDLNCRFKVSVKTRTQKMEKYKTILLEAEQVADQPAMKAEKVEKVLSEGEKRAVAMADFLTEVALDEKSCGLILDDPVTSLDWEWKEIVAKRLAIEAKDRQVIIFTHDLHFHYLIKKHTKANEVELASHLICRNGTDSKPGFIYQNASPATEGDHRKPQHAIDAWQRAKSASSPMEQEPHLNSGFGYLRRSYEALVCYNILGKVVTRFEERVSVGRLKDVITDKEILDQVMEKYELLSANMGSHLPHGGAVSVNFTPEKLKQEIDDYEAIRKRVSPRNQ